MNFNNVAIFSVKGSDYRIHFWYMRKDDVINIMKSSDLNEKTGLLWNISLIQKEIKLLIIKVTEKKKLNPAKEYYKSNIIENYLTKKNIKREYGRNRY